MVGGLVDGMGSGCVVHNMVGDMRSDCVVISLLRLNAMLCLVCYIAFMFISLFMVVTMFMLMLTFIPPPSLWSLLDL